MASFTDKTPQFNPYIQQLPVDAMVSVGTQKQGLYNQGIQRIQSQIDSVAGLDVARDVDKAYLQSKMNKLGDSLKLVAAGDFSDFQLVNSVGGMVNQIAKDDNVMNAVVSTRNYRQGLMDMKEAIKEGKSNASNEWDFQTRAAEWLNSNDINQSFSGGYHPYTDYRGKLLDAIKQLKPDVNVTDLSFTTNSKGELVPTDATTRQKLSGIPPEKLQQAVMSVMTPSDWKQMEIDGRYSYANIPPEEFAQSVTNSYREKYDALVDQRNKLKNAIYSTNSPSEKRKLEQQIESVDKVINNVNSEYEGIARTFINGDAESAKANLYTTNFINGFSNAFSYTETSSTQETNPNATIQMQREIKNQDWNKFLITENRLERQLALDQDKFEFDKKNKEAEQKEQSIGGGLGSTTQRADVPIITIDDVSDKLQEDVQSLGAMDAEFRGDHDEQWFEQQLEAYTRGGGDAKTVAYFNKTAQLRRTVNRNYSLIKDINAKMKAKYRDVYNPILAKLPSANIRVGDQNISFSPQEIFDFNIKADSLIQGQIREGSPKNDKIAEENFTPREMVLYDLSKRGHSNETGWGINISPDEREAYKAIRQVEKQASDPYLGNKKEMDKEVQQQLNERIGMSQGGRYAFDTSKEAGKLKVANLLSMIAQDAERGNGAIAGDKKFSIEAARAIIPKVSSGFIEIVEGTEYNKEPLYRVNVTSTEGKNIDFKITRQQKRDYYGNEFELPENISAIREYQNQITKTGKGTTAYDGKETTLYNAYIDRSQFPNTHYGINGNLEQIIDENGEPKYQFRLNIYDPIGVYNPETKQWEGKGWQKDIGYPPTGYVSEDKVNPNKMRITDELLYQLLHGDLEGYDQNYQKELEKASKNPF